MFTRIVVGTIVLACTLPASRPLAAQERTSADSIAAEVRRLQARLDSLERVIERLLREGRDPAPAQDELAALRAAARQAAQEVPPPDNTQGGESRTRGLHRLNPEISVTGDIVGNLTAPAGGGTHVSATPREFEFSFQAALDPYTHTKVFVTREEEFEVAGLSEHDSAEADTHGGFHIEEGYMYWVGLPGGLGAKLGKFRQEIGLYNRWHTHALFEVDRPLAAAAFLGEDGLIQTGAQVTMPALHAGPLTQSTVFEVTRGDNEALFEHGHDMSYLGRLQSFVDLGADAYVQFGATGVLGENDELDLASRVLALDVAFRWSPAGQALYRDVQLKGEWYLVERDEAGLTTSASGGYGQINTRLSRQWILGARVDYLRPFDAEPEVLQIAPSLTWWQSEWVRLRLQYNLLRQARGDANHTVLLQAVWAMGPHKHESY